MNTVIRDQVLPLVGKVRWTDFNKDNFGSLMSLQTKLIKHTNGKNKDKLRMYLAICVEAWPVFNNCPIDRDIIKGAIDLLNT